MRIFNAIKIGILIVLTIVGSIMIPLGFIVLQLLSSLSDEPVVSLQQEGYRIGTIGVLMAVFGTVWLIRIGQRKK